MLRKVHLIRDEVLGEASSKYICSGHGGAGCDLGREGKRTLALPLRSAAPAALTHCPKSVLQVGTREGPGWGTEGVIFSQFIIATFRPDANGYQNTIYKHPSCSLADVQVGDFLQPPLTLLAHSVLITKASPFPPILQDTAGNAISGTHCECVCVFASMRRKCTKKKTYTPPKKKQHTCDVIFGTIDAS